MKRIFMLWVPLLAVAACLSSQPRDDGAVDLPEAYRIAREEALKWDASAKPYFITSVDDPIESNAVKGADGKRSCWNFDFVVPDTNRHLIVTVDEKAVVAQTEAESNTNSTWIMDMAEFRFSTKEAVRIAKEEYGLLPGTNWAQGYHFVLENDGSGLILSVVGRNGDGDMSRISFYAATGEVTGFVDNWAEGRWNGSEGGG